ncbi:vitamin K epoxide reductase family protein [Klugiella xanthotipulae]|uniref:Putative membrane protein n=1 Tax=Klugiella xanthotipulae TaxID=244735 RepID=A0A543HSJ4_9MICO|nr:vitamin K epoxide reductase family protein [Klugiella xanthotipulae]TQM61234.1 putative membrane protein [Klugiella xanthotipulae]
MGNNAPRRRPVGFAIFTVLAGIVGWFASFELLTERINTLIDPTHVPNCNISLLVSCGPNMGSWQGSVFGFSNTILGVAFFMAPIIVGISLLSGAQFAHWYWRTYLVGLTFGIGFVAWLSTQSIFNLGTLCPWCMVVWTVTIPLFWYTLFFTAKEGHLGLPASWQNKANTVYSWAWVVTIACYLIIAVIAQINLDWFAEVARSF